MHRGVTVLCEASAISLRCVSEPSEGKAVLIFLSSHYLSLFAFFFFVEEEKGEQSSAHSRSGQMGETLGGRYKKTDYITALQQLQP